MLLFNVVPRNSSSCNLGCCVESSIVNIELEGGFFFWFFFWGWGEVCGGRGVFLVANLPDFPDFPSWGLDFAEQG
jgi:hypothetical protein